MNGGQRSTMPPETAVARALYEKRGLMQQCSSSCVDHFAHDYSSEASACREPARPQDCEATLRHAHGLSQCELPAGHDGKHAAYCDDCYDDDVLLTWTQEHEVWPI